MAIVNFSVPKPLDQRINDMIKQKGFASKAEFFRFASLYYLDVVGASTTHNEEAEMDRLSGLIAEKVNKHYKGKNLPSVREQLENL